MTSGRGSAPSGDRGIDELEVPHATGDDRREHPPGRTGPIVPLGPDL